MLLTRAPVAGGSASTPPLPFDLHVLSLPLAFILSQDQTLRSILVCRFPVRGNRRVSINSKKKVNSKKYQMYSLACINLSSEAHARMPSVRHSIRFSRCRRARARRSRLVAAQERTIPASRMPCQGKFSRDFSDPLRRRRCLQASRASRFALRAGLPRLELVIIPAPAVL